MRNPGVVIVGAGVMGASVAYHLAARGRRDVLVIDNGSAAGEGSTSRATGGFRAQYGTAINVRLSLLTRSKLRRFSDEIGGECGYVPAGYLWLASSAGVLKGLAEARALQHAEGLTEATAVTPDEVALINPAIALDGILGGSFCPTDGFIRPLGILNGYLDAAQRLGVDVSWGEEAVDAERNASGRITAILTTRRRIATGTVINAAGAWAGALGSACGLNVPVSPLRRQVALTEPTRVLPDSMPMTIFTDDGFHLRVRDGRVLLLWPTPGLPGRPFDATVDAEWIDAVAAKAHARVPVLRDVTVDRAGSWAGLYEMSPDKHAILGPHPDCENLFLINGSSGHGVMHAPALGHLLAEIVLDGRATTIDTHQLRPERFSEGDLNESAGPL
jgi:glycine/D-amino acid oxidase-like deaminating enzyme